MKNFLILVIIFLISCHIPTRKENVNNSYMNNFMGKKISIEYGDHDHFLQMIGGDSLFVHTTLTNTSFSYIYFTKDTNVKSVSWDTGGKYSKRITNIKDE